MTDLEELQQYFEEYQQRFGLNGYRVYFKYDDSEKTFACISRNHYTGTATVFLNDKLPEKDLPFKNIKRSAKHEAIHLLLTRMEYLANDRHASADEIYAAEEELVHKLECLIPD